MKIWNKPLYKHLNGLFGKHLLPLSAKYTICTDNTDNNYNSSIMIINFAQIIIIITLPENGLK